MSKKLTHEEFVNNANRVHDFKYTYLDTYVNATTKLRIVCDVHGIFLKSPDNHVSKKQGCPVCSNTTKSHEQFLLDAVKCHGNKYTYPDKYVNVHSKIRIICPIHGEFTQIVNDHINSGRGCMQCHLNTNKKKHEDFVNQANYIHNNMFEYPDRYQTSFDKIRIVCKEHGDFFQTPNNHVNGKQCCPNCQSKHSQMAIDWLNKIMDNDGIFIQHALNSGEYKIPGTRYKADGYCHETNTIYEFHGDYWHGNPIVHKSDSYNEVTKSTMGELYERTLLKERIIRDLGYKLIVVWEQQLTVIQEE